MKDLIKTIWNAKPNKYWGIGIAIILFGFLKVINYEFPTTQAEKERNELKRIKKCAREVRIMRKEWYFEETGQIISLKSSAPQDLQNYYDNNDIKPKSGREIPYKDCTQNSKYK
tara:strand:- start:41 stop:382 length:342 start_codon:yes stop_codon:yes gene_type:complete